MAAKIIPVSVFDCIVFGATGDLTTRKLLPALYWRFRDGQMPAASRVIGVARADMDDDAFRARASEALEKHVDPDHSIRDTFADNPLESSFPGASEGSALDEVVVSEPPMLRIGCPTP